MTARESATLNVQSSAGYSRWRGKALHWLRIATTGMIADVERLLNQPIRRDMYRPRANKLTTNTLDLIR